MKKSVKQQDLIDPKPGKPLKLTKLELQKVVRMGKGSRLLQEMAYSSLINAKLYSPDERKKFKYLSHEAFFLKYGLQFTPQPFPSKFKKWHGEMGDCSLNALLLACAYQNELHYVEGFALSAKIAAESPHLHAWCVDNDGNVVDPTWRDKLMGQEYCGLVFKLLPLSYRHFSGRQYGFIFNDELFNRIAKGEIKEKDWKEWLQKWHNKGWKPLQSRKSLKPREILVNRLGSESEARSSRSRYQQSEPF